MSDFFSALSAIPGLIADFSGSTSNPYGAQERQQGANMSAASAALADTSNPLYKKLYGQYQDQNRQNIAQSIAELQGQNRMASSMGRTPLLDPNRGGETIFRNLMQGYQNSGTQSDAQTRAALQGALSGANTTGNFYGAINGQAAKAGTAQLQGYQGIANILGQITGQNASPYAPQNTTANPNYPSISGQIPTSNYMPNAYGQLQQGWAGN